MNKRIERFQEILQKNEIDGALYAKSANMQYLLDDVTYHWQRTMYTGGLPHMWPEGLAGHFLNNPDSILYIPATGEPVLFLTPACEEDMKHLPYKKEIGYFHRLMDMVQPYLTGKKIALGESCFIYFKALIEEYAPDMEWVDGEKLVAKMRQIKDAKEIELMRYAATFTDEAMKQTVEILKPGITKAQVESFLSKIGQKAGARDVSFPPSCLFIKSGTDMKLGSDKPDMVLEAGTAIAFDFGYVLNGYCSDYGRSFYLGHAPKHYSDGYKALQEAQCYLLEQIKPGISMDLCRKTLESKLSEFGDYAKFLRGNPVSGLMGHQIGIDVHEHPWVHDEQKQVFEPGMVMCIEPKLWIPSEGYMRVEDMILVMETGCESLTKFDRNLFCLSTD